MKLRPSIANARLKDLVEIAVRERDPKTAVKVAEFLRFRHGFNYDDIYRFVNDRAPIPLAEWDALLG